MRLVLLVLATARLTRFVTEDSLGGWWLRGPVERWGGRHEARAINAAIEAEHERVAGATIAATWLTLDGETHDNPTAFVFEQYDRDQPWSWQGKVASGIDCRWCVGFWLGVLVLLAEAVAPRVPLVRSLWTFALRALALNSASNAVGQALRTLP